MGNYEVKLEFKKEDLWVGVFWKPNHVWICIIPCVPIHIYRKDSSERDTFTKIVIAKEDQR